MISLISWVSDEEQYAALKESVTFPCEFIKVGQEAKSMAEAYNIGTKQAKTDWKVYVHQDVRFYDEYFAEKLEQFTPYVGMVGVVGSNAKTDKSWWDTPRGSWRGRLIQGDRFQVMGDIGPCRNLDGLLLATNKTVVFPQELPGIHFVDMWACRAMEQQGLYNWVMPTIVQHLSQGKLNDEYFSNLKIYQKAWL